MLKNIIQFEQTQNYSFDDGRRYLFDFFFAKQLYAKHEIYTHKHDIESKQILMQS